MNLSGKSGGYSFGGGFHTDESGELTLPIPEDMEFTVEASFFQCYSQQFTFNTENGIRWRETKSASGNSSGMEFRSELPQWLPPSCARRLAV